MALTRASIEALISFTDTLTAPGAARVPSINDKLSLAFPVVTATHNRVHYQRYSVASSGTQVIDLASLTNQYTAAAVVLTKAAGILITGTQSFTLGPNNAANPLPWFFGGNTQTVVFDANDFFLAKRAVTFTTGSKLLLTNTGGGTGLFDVCIIGGT